MFLEKGVLKIFSKFTGEQPCLSVISKNVQSDFIKITLGHGCSAVDLLYIFTTPFPKNTSGVLLLKIVERLVIAKASRHLGQRCIQNGFEIFQWFELPKQRRTKSAKAASINHNVFERVSPVSNPCYKLKVHPFDPFHFLGKICMFLNEQKLRNKQGSRQKLKRKISLTRIETFNIRCRGYILNQTKLF